MGSHRRTTLKKIPSWNRTSFERMEDATSRYTRARTSSDNASQSSKDGVRVLDRADSRRHVKITKPLSIREVVR